MRASQTVNPRNTVLHVSGFFEGQGAHQTSREKPKASSYAQTEMPPPPESTKSLPSSEQADMETSICE